MKCATALLLSMAIALAGCKATVVSHDEDKAALRATQFARIAFISRKYERAYALLVPELKRKVSIEDFRNTIKKMHPDGYPSSIRAIAYKPDPGKEEMQIFLTGTEGANVFYYRISMYGTKSTDYRIAGMYRNSIPYPETSIRLKLDRKIIGQ